MKSEWEKKYRLKLGDRLSGQNYFMGENARINFDKHMKEFDKVMRHYKIDKFVEYVYVAPYGEECFLNFNILSDRHYSYVSFSIEREENDIKLFIRRSQYGINMKPNADTLISLKEMYLENMGLNEILSTTKVT